ncbi:hypothetical protein MAR_020075 [Mya arenaria]|uniref:Uncharacterized protein n=1 Tax=Mya arenaria TaxID=6604 RepID=A0ABY7EC40_MYAAR|nr:hypothetical protein MAR_020075 [Mya arenaria]
MMMNAMTKPTCVTIIVQTRKGRIAAHVEQDTFWTLIIALVQRKAINAVLERTNVIVMLEEPDVHIPTQMWE